jgi:hypothetical protein
MTTEQAISTFQDHINEGKITPDHPADCGYCEACHVAIIALSKQIPIAPIVEKYFYGVNIVCPTCESGISVASKFCQNCGQAIKKAGDTK